MLRKLSKEVRDCYARAEECARKAKQVVNEELQKDYLRTQQSWLTVARSYEFVERLLNFSKENNRRRAEFYGDNTLGASRFFDEKQTFAEPIRCDRCGGTAHLVRRMPDRTKEGYEVHIFACRDCEVSRRSEITVRSFLV